MRTLVLNRWIPEADECVEVNRVEGVTNVEQHVEFTPGFRHTSYTFTRQDGTAGHCWDDQNSTWEVLEST